MVRPSHDLHQSWLGCFYLHNAFTTQHASSEIKSNNSLRPLVCLLALFVSSLSTNQELFFRSLRRVKNWLATSHAIHTSQILWEISKVWFTH
jgi:hypothetical protein